MDSRAANNQRSSSLPADEAGFLATRESLLGRLKSLEDQATWQDFFNTYWRLLYSVGLKSGLTPEEAQDAVQDTIVAVVRNIKEFHYDPGRCSFKSWLLMITRQRVIWQLRKRPPPGPLAAASDDSTRTAPIDRIPDPESLDLDAVWKDEWERNVVGVAVERVKRQVSARQFQIFDLSALQGWPVKDIARTLGVSTTQVYLARHRVGRLLKRQIQLLEESRR